MAGNTINFLLNLPDFNFGAWHTLVNDNFREIDAVLGQFTKISNFRGVWKQSTTYSVSDVVVDPTDGIMYRANTGHTSTSTGTRSTDSANWDTVQRPLDMLANITTLSAASNTIQATALDINTDRMYEVYGEFTGDGGTAQNIRLTVNNDNDDGDYADEVLLAGSGSSATSSTFTGPIVIASMASGATGFVRARIILHPTDDRVFFDVWSKEIGTTDVELRQYAYDPGVTVSNVTSVELRSVTGQQFAIGSRLRVYRRN